MLNGLDHETVIAIAALIKNRQEAARERRRLLKWTCLCG